MTPLILERAIARQGVIFRQQGKPRMPFPVFGDKSRFQTAGRAGNAEAGLLQSAGNIVSREEFLQAFLRMQEDLMTYFFIRGPVLFRQFPDPLLNLLIDHFPFPLFSSVLNLRRASCSS